VERTRRIRIGRLTTVGEVAAELGRLYRHARRGEIPVGDASRLATNSEVVMRLESKECRLQALTCERLAQRSTSPIVKGAYADLAKKWLKVADELQAVNAAKPSPYRQNEEAPYSARTGASKNAGSAA
jgi:hypothetical protein